MPTSEKSHTLADDSGKLDMPFLEHSKTSFEKKLFFCVGEYAEYGFDQQRLIWYVCRLCQHCHFLAVLFYKDLKLGRIVVFI